MSRKVISSRNYTFTPGTRTVVIPSFVPQENLLLIVNSTTGTIVYNFSDPALGATSYTITENTSSQSKITTVVLEYNTA